MRFTKRIQALLLALIVAAAFMPAGVYADDPAPSGDGIVLNKTYDPEKEEITLEAYVTGESQTVIVQDPIPAHITLVLDMSYSMVSNSVYSYKVDTNTTGYTPSNYNNHYILYNGAYYQIQRGGNNNNNYYLYFSVNNKRYYLTKNGITTTQPAGVRNNEVVYTGELYTRSSQTRLAALKTAAKSFIDTIYQNSIDKKVDNQVSIVVFSDDNNSSTRVIKDLTVVNTTASRDSLKQTIDNIQNGTYTAVDRGMQKALGIVQNDNPNYLHSKAVVLFTDGSPNQSGMPVDDFSNNTTVKNYASQTIATAKMIKDAGATVWTVGLFGENGPTGSQRNFMDYTSSDYPNATSYNNSGAKASDKYFSVTASAEGLNDIFTSIAEESSSGGAAVKFDERAVVQDVMSPYFDIETSDTDDIKVYTSKYKGNDSWDSLVPYTGDVTFNSITKDGVTRDAVLVAGFRYSENWCGMSTDAQGVETPHGKKLVIKFPAVDNGLGYGEDVPTNTAGISAIYPGDPDETEPAKAFPTPTVDIPYIAVNHSSDNSTDIIRVKDVNSSTLDITQPRDNIVKKQKKTDTECGDYKGVKGANIYGGAFSSDAYSTVATYKNGNPMCGTEIDLTKVKDETIYMKEVSNAFLQPKTVTLSKDAAAVKASYLLTAADSNKYQKVGFDFGGREKECTFTENLTVKMVNGKVNTFTVGNLFDLSGNLALVKIPYTDAGAATEIKDGVVYTANPFWVTLDGVKVTGIKSRTLTYKTGSLDKLAGEEYNAGDDTKAKTTESNPSINDKDVDSTTKKYRSSVNGFKTMALYSTAAIVPDEDGSGELEMGEVLVPSETYTFGAKGVVEEEQPVVEEPKAEEPVKEQVTVGKVKIKSVTGAKKNFTVKWNKLKKVNGYKVAYKKNGNSKWTYKYVSSSKTSYKTLSKLKKGTYKVKVKAYKKVDGKKIYGKYSSTKSVKVK